MLAAIVLAVPLVITYLDTGLVPRFPTAILVTGMMIVAVLCFFAGLILDTVTRGRREMRRLAYLASAAHRLWQKSNSPRPLATAGRYSIAPTPLLLSRISEIT